jgi:glycine betaine catabolism B
MKFIKTNFLEKIKLTETVMSFRFQPVEPVSFVPGQFGRIMFDMDDQNNKDLNKYLSFSVSPSKGYLEFTKRLSSSAFSNRLRALNLGDEVMVAGPMGNCVFKDEYKKVAFLAGGIGITPVISMLEYIDEKRLETDVALFYSNRVEDEIAFKDKIDSWKKNNSNWNIVYLITDCAPKGPDCIGGKLDLNILSSKIKDWQERTVFVFGPPKMVDTIKPLCLNVGCLACNLKTEGFIGY